MRLLLKGLQASPENEQMRLLLAVSLGTQRRFDEAIGHYEIVSAEESELDPGGEQSGGHAGRPQKRSTKS